MGGAQGSHSHILLILLFLSRSRNFYQSKVLLPAGCPVRFETTAYPLCNPVAM